MQPRIILLGPQRHLPIVRDAVAALVDLRAPLAVVTAGWEEREAETGELQEHLRCPVVNLDIWQRVEQIFVEDPELLAAMRGRHDRLRQLQELYRIRLAGLMEATAELFSRDGDDALLVPERNDALVMLQALDEQHVARVANLHGEFTNKWQPLQRDAVARHRRELAAKLQDVQCLLLAGGHVPVLQHRLALFDVLGLHGDRPIVAWSAGAMVLCEKVVLFHDAPPQGSAHAEVMEAGFGLVPDVVVLPHAKRRLRSDDTRRMALFAGRFAPAHCVLLDDGSRLDYRNGVLAGSATTRCIDRSGSLQEAACLR